MPQFDIASFYPQITFFTVIFLLLYVFLTRNILPKISQNLKLNKRIAENYNSFAIKRLKDLNLLSYIYKPTQILSHLIYKETLCILFLNQFLKIITVAYISSLNWFLKNQEKDLKIRLFKLNLVYLNVLNDIYYNTRK
jgi:hypothetical protein